jgi:23S rRNA pseudouridine1911/1915/1917 synthase
MFRRVPFHSVVDVCRKRLLVSSSYRRASSRGYSPLKPPTVLFSDNHLLVVNKPAGWHSVPNPQPSPKCLLSELKRLQLGGGSRKDFLLPLHRIDQPCSGVLLLGKTSKAASRITTLWKNKLVEKDYLCVVSASRTARLQHISSDLDDGWYSLQGQMQRRPSGQSRSVIIRQDESSSSSSELRAVSIYWKLVHPNPIKQAYSLLLVRTSDGARHMVRALLAQVGACPMEGDVRYDAAAATLQDQSVALHAFRVSLDTRLKLGTLKTFDFQAPVPSTWGDYFGIQDDSIVM